MNRRLKINQTFKIQIEKKKVIYKFIALATFKCIRQINSFKTVSIALQIVYAK